MAGTAIALHAPAGGPTPPAAPRRRLHARARSSCYEPTPVGAAAASRARRVGRIAFQFNPKELTISKSAKWERKPPAGRKTRRPAGVQRRRAVQADAGDVLRRHRHAGRQRRRAASRSSSPAACRPRRAWPRRRRRPRSWCFHWGSVTQLPGYVTSVQRQVHAVHRRTARRSAPSATCRLEEMPGDPPKQNPTSGALAPRVGAHRRRRRHARLRSPTGVRRPDDVAAARRVQRHRRPAAAAARARPCCCPAVEDLLARGGELAGQQITNAFTVEVDGHAAAGRPRAAARVARTSTTACNLPDLVRAAVPRPGPAGAAKTGIEDRRAARGAGADQRGDHAPSR